MKRMSLTSWLWIIIGALYFLLPLIATADFSLRAEKDKLGFLAYERVFADPRFISTFTFSLYVSILTIIASIILVVPTAYWVRLRVPAFRRAFEFITLLPLIIPAVVLVFGLSRIYGKYPFQFMIETPALFVVGNVIICIAR